MWNIYQQNYNLLRKNSVLHKSKHFLLYGFMKNFIHWRLRIVGDNQFSILRYFVAVREKIHLQSQSLSNFVADNSIYYDKYCVEKKFLSVYHDISVDIIISNVRLQNLDAQYTITVHRILRNSSVLLSWIS